MAVKDNLNYRNLFEVPILQQLLDFDVENILNKINTQNAGVQKSNIGGWQSDNISGFSEYNHILSILENCVNDYAKKFDMKYIQKIDNAWVNVNSKGNSNSKHIHPNTMLSGVVYLKTPKDCGNIVFYHPIGHMLQYDWSKENFKTENTFNSYCWEMPVVEKCLYVFPSWQSHSVDMNSNEDDRITIAFNTINTDRLC